MDQIHDFLLQTFFDNTIEKYFLALLFIILGLAFNKLLAGLLGRIIYRFLKKASHGVNLKMFFQLIRKPFRLFFMLIFVYIAFDYIHFPREWHLAEPYEFGLRMILLKMYEIVFILTIIWMVLKVIDFFGMVFKQRLKEEDQAMNEQMISIFVDIIKISLLIFGFFIILGSVFRVNIGSIIAGLGIGGLALALAAKPTLENLFGSFAIFLDKPFVMGDLIQVGETKGHVEKLGFRSTRVRTLDKKFVTIPNKLVIDAHLINFTQREEQRASFNLYFKQSSAAERIRSFMAELKQIIDKQENTLDNSSINFSDIEKNSYKISVLYFVKTTDADIFTLVKEDINFSIFEIASNYGLEFDFPETNFLMKTE